MNGVQFHLVVSILGKRYAKRTMEYVFGKIIRMRVSEFHKLLTDEFGTAKAEWVAHSHVLSGFGATADEVMEKGEDLRKVWQQICDDFDVPEERRLGLDD